MLWIALYLPDLPVQVFSRAKATPAPLVVATSGSPREVVAANSAALACGILPGLRISSALAINPHLLIKPRLPEAEAGLLESLAGWALQFTPQVCLDPPDGVVLEVEGSLRLFGGINALFDEISKGLQALGLQAGIACAPTPRAAGWLARFKQGTLVMRTQDLVEALADLPVAYLTDHAPTQKLFAGISCLTFGDCEALPRAGLSHRGAQSFLRLRDQALGETADPRVSWQAPDQFDQRIELPWPATRSDTLIFACKRLFSALMATLKARQKVIEHFTLEFEHPKNPPTTMKIHLGSACRDEARWILLTREHLSLRALPEPAEAITLKADEWQDEQDSSDSLFPDFRKGQEARSVLIARLRARLGENAVSQLSLRADHRPEHCFTRLSGGQPEKMSAHEGARPVWLFETPSPLCSSPHTPWKDPQLICLAGPERIESGWWEGQEVARDYYIAQHRDGRIWWLFQDLNAPYAWFIHGLFS